MKCKELVDFLTEYQEGKLPLHKRLFFEFHLKLCPPCKEFLETYRASIKLGKKCCCHSDEIPPTVPEEFIQAVLKASKATPCDKPESKTEIH